MSGKLRGGVVTVFGAAEMGGGVADTPPWLRRLAAAVLLQALRDARKPEFQARLAVWIHRGGTLGDSDYTVCSVLGLSHAELCTMVTKASTTHVQEQLARREGR